MSIETVACLGVVMAASLILNLLTMVNKLRTGYQAVMASLATIFGRGRHIGRPNSSTMEAQAPMALAPLAQPDPAHVALAPAPAPAPLALTLAPSAPPAPPTRPGTHTHTHTHTIKDKFIKKSFIFYNNILE